MSPSVPRKVGLPGYEAVFCPSVPRKVGLPGYEAVFRPSVPRKVGLPGYDAVFRPSVPGKGCLRGWSGGSRTAIQEFSQALPLAEPDDADAGLAADGIDVGDEGRGVDDDLVGRS